MKKLFVLLLFLITGSYSFSNAIDRIKTLKEVKEFLVQKVSKNYSDAQFIPVFSFDYPGNSKNRFLKLDLDKNGMTDLIIHIESNSVSFYGKYELLAIIDMGKGQYKPCFLNTKPDFYGKTFIKKILKIKPTPLLIIQQFKIIPNSKDSIEYLDTLVLKFGSLVEYNPYPKNPKIDRIHFDFGVGGMEVGIPRDQLLIQSNREAILTIELAGHPTKIFKAKIDSILFNQLIGLLNYMDMVKLKNEYANNTIMDGPTFRTEFNFSDGENKIIRDYAFAGSFGLLSFYEWMSDIRRKTPWKSE